jgi:hypothetical protein
MRKLTVIIPTHDPCLERFRDTLRGLRATEAEFAVQAIKSKQPKKGTRPSERLNISHSNF